MSAHNSDSEGSWSMVDRPGEEDEDKASSTSSLDFVKVQSSEAVSYHHKDQKEEDETHDLGVESDSAESG